ncbi:MAG: VTT domain-containing protein [Solirubrobacterales bacterium]|nr:VTT domain-containing protein [Solirubrobacterales bacterium]
MSSHEIHQLLHQYGLIAVFLAVALQAFWLPIPGSTVVIVAATYAASRHDFPIVGVIVVAALGVLTGTLGGFALGRWRGEWALLKLARLLRQPPERVQWLREQLDRRAVIALFLSRWFTGTRNAAGIAAGASGMGLARFTSISAGAALLWAAITGVEFYYFGGVFFSLPTWLKITVVGVGVGATVATGVLVRSMNAQKTPT